LGYDVVIFAASCLFDVSSKKNLSPLVVNQVVLIRLPVQFVLIAWAWYIFYIKNNKSMNSIDKQVR
ncbi:MAG: hypothetical protein U5M51_09385, partial [Emticicia sp.]|nr:hypothetical protein [Emticicia sp.]